MQIFRHVAFIKKKNCKRSVFVILSYIFVSLFTLTETYE